MRQLKCFVAAAELENFTAASERMNMSQSALSRQIATLEAGLGVTLFDRTGRGVSLSAAGRRLKSAAERLIADFASLRTLVQSEAAHDLVGEVTVAAGMASGSMLFPRLSRAAARELPGVKLHFIQARAEEAEESLLSGKADLSVIAHPADNPRLKSSPLFRQNLYVGYPPSAGVDLGPTCSIKEALAQPLVMPGGGRERLFVEQLAAQHGMELKVADDTNGMLEAALMMTYQDFVLLPGSAIFDRKPDPLRRFSRVHDAVLMVYLVERADQIASEAASEVIRLIRKDVGRLQQKGVLQSFDTPRPD